MKNLLPLTGLFLTACGNTYVPPVVMSQSYVLETANPGIVNTPQPYYYCYHNGMVVRRNHHHPRFQRTWIYAPYENCF